MAKVRLVPIRDGVFASAGSTDGLLMIDLDDNARLLNPNGDPQGGL